MLFRAIKLVAAAAGIALLAILLFLAHHLYHFGSFTTIADLRADEERALLQFEDADAVMQALLAQADDDSGYQLLFANSNLAGWQGSTDIWRIENGELVGESSEPLEKQEFLVSDRRFSDFAIKFDFLVDGESLANSGLFYRAELVDEADHYINGYQADIDFSTLLEWAGSFFDERSYYDDSGFHAVGKLQTHTGQRVWVGPDDGRVVVDQLGDPDELVRKLSKGEWASYTIVASGNRFIHRINGEVYSDTILEAPERKTGRLAFQLHQYLAMTARFRNVRVKELSASMQVDDSLLANEHAGQNWATWGRTFSVSHYSPLEQVNRDNVRQLELAWYRDLNVNQRADSQPLALNGVLYVAAGLSIVQALDAATGELIWRYDPEVHKFAGERLRGSWGIRGLALWGELVIVGTHDGRLIALNQKTGGEAWSVQTLEPGEESAITGPPRVYDGKVVIGFGGAERAYSRGAVSAWDAASGEFLWRFYTVPGNPADGFENAAMEMAAQTWSGEWWKFGGGGTVWHGISYDHELDQLYIGTGNGSPQNWQVRNPEGKDNLFLASIVALDADTGEYRWHYQQNPNEAWDYNSTMDMVLDTMEIDGMPRKVLLHAPKNGFFYIIDRETGKLLSARQIARRVNWADGIDLETGRPVDRPGARYRDAEALIWPGAEGAHSWPPMSLSPITGLVYIPTMHQATAFSSQGVVAEQWEPAPKAWNNGLGWAATPLPVDEFGSALIAWDPEAQQIVWEQPTPGVWNGGTMATAGNLVFQGHIDGSFNAFDAQTGERLWRFDAGVPVLGPPVSFSWQGRQLIAVLSGPPIGPVSFQANTAAFGWRYRDHPRRILVFALDGTATLPAVPAPGLEAPLVDDTFALDADKVMPGLILYHQHCFSCHGAQALAAGAAPDLRASPIMLNFDVFAAIVRDGALLSAGMPQYSEFNDEQLQSLQHYIRSAAGN